MAWIERLSKQVCRVTVRIGTTASGAVKTANVNLPAVDPNGYDVTKFSALIQLYQPILSNLYSSQTIKTYSVEEE